MKNTKNGEENKALPVVQKRGFMSKFKKKLMRYTYMGLSVFGIVFPYVSTAAEMSQVEPPKIPPIKEEIKGDLESQYQERLSEIGVTIVEEEEKFEIMEIPDDPPEEQREEEVPNFEPKISAKGPDDDFEFHSSLIDLVEEEGKLYINFKKRKEKEEKEKENISKEAEDKNKKGKNNMER